MNQPKTCSHCRQMPYSEIDPDDGELLFIEPCLGKSTVPWDGDSYAGYVGYEDASVGLQPETSCPHYMAGWEQGYEDYFGQRARWLNGEEL